jgi:spore germination protein KC
MRRSILNLRLISIILLCIFCLTYLTACYDSREVDDWTFVYVLGIDKGVADKLRLTILFPTLKQSAGGTGGMQGTSGASSGNEYSVLSIDCPTIFAGMNMINTTLDRTINYSHAKYIIISEEMAKKGVETFLNGMVRTRQIRRSMYVIVAKGKASEFINEFNPLVGTAISKTLEGMMNMEKENGLIDEVSYFDFINDMKSTYNMPTAALASLNDFSHYKTSGSEPSEFVGVGDYYAGQIPRRGGNAYEFIGSAVFDGDKMVGELNGEETRSKLMVTGEFERGVIAIQDPKNPDLRVAVDVSTEKKSNIKVKFEKGKPVISVKLFLEGDLVNLQSDFNYEKGELKQLLEKKYSEYIKKILDKTIDKCQALNTDIFGFGDTAARHFGTIQEFEGYNWLGHFKDAKVITEVNFVIRRTGTMLKTNKTRTSEGAEE